MSFCHFVIVISNIPSLIAVALWCLNWLYVLNNVYFYHLITLFSVFLCNFANKKIRIKGMPLVLEQNKLDVVHKQRSNFFNWKGQFTPEFVEYLLDSYATENSIIADPFSGSGTVLSESIRKDMSCIRYEVNPSAYFMSKFYEYAMYTVEERHRLFDEFRATVGVYVQKMPKNLMVYVDNPDYRVSYQNLRDFATYIANNLDSKLLPLMINVLFLCEKDKKMGLKDSLIRNIVYMRDLFFSLPHTSKSVIANLGDARSLGVSYKNLVDLVITSPPYINVFNYHQNYRGIIECFGYDILKVAASEFGSNRKNRQNRFKTVVQYAMDMGHTLLNTSMALKTGGRMIFVVGRESMVRKTPFYNSCIIEDAVAAIPSIQIESINERKFSNRYGECIFEDIITIVKNQNDNDVDLKVFADIGMKHIENALSYASSELEGDLLSILSKRDTISESPIY